MSMPGAGLALVIPSGQSLVADYYSAASRGSAFGALYLTSALGGMGGSIVATNLGKCWLSSAWNFQCRQMCQLLHVLGAKPEVCMACTGEMTIAGTPGWRVTFFLVAAIRCALLLPHQNHDASTLNVIWKYALMQLSIRPSGNDNSN